MLLKTYRAADLATALAQARAELGPDARVLATSERRGRLGLSVVEVTAAALRPSPPAAPDDGDALDEFVGDVESRHRLDRPPEVAHLSRPAPAPTAGAARMERMETEELHPTLATAVAALVESGLSEDLAVRFARIAARDLPQRPDARALATAAARGLDEIVRTAGIPLSTRCLFVVGPPGAGKTTTVAKLAARRAAEGAGPVLLGEANVERVGAFEQARIFADHLGIELARIDRASDLSLALERFAGGTVLVDTPGVAADDDERLQFVAELRRAAPDAAVAVLLPSGLHRDEAARVLARFTPLAPQCVGLSRVDDGFRPGELLTAVAGCALPVAFFTTGHAVPDDIEAASARGLATLLLRAGHHASMRREAR